MSTVLTVETHKITIQDVRTFLVFTLSTGLNNIINGGLG